MPAIFWKQAWHLAEICPNLLIEQTKFAFYGIEIRVETLEIEILSVALLSQAKKSECGMAQPSFCIAGFNVPNKQYVRTTPRNQGLNQSEA